MLIRWLSSSGNASSTRRAVAARVRLPLLKRPIRKQNTARLTPAHARNKAASIDWGSLKRASARTNRARIPSEIPAASTTAVHRENVRHRSHVCRSLEVTASTWGDMVSSD